MTEIEKGRLDELAEEIIAEHRAFVRTFRKPAELPYLWLLAPDLLRVDACR